MELNIIAYYGYMESYQYKVSSNQSHIVNSYYGYYFKVSFITKKKQHQIFLSNPTPPSIPHFSLPITTEFPGPQQNRKNNLELFIIKKQ
jgi:hypothetical protein